MKTTFAGAAITWGIGIVVAAVSGCGADASKLEPLSGCTGWQPLTQPAPMELILAPLAFVNGNVVYSTFLSQGVFAQPAVGGAAVKLAPDFAFWLAADGDAVVYATGNFGSQFFSVPVAGGTPQMLFDASVGRPDVGASLLATMTSTDFVWTEVRQAGVSPWTVWRAPKTGGTPTMLASLPVPSLTNTTIDLGFSAIAVGSDTVDLASLFGIADAVPLAGGAPRALLAPMATAQGAGSLSGVDASGAYWQQLRAGAPSSDDAWDIFLSPVDGSAATEFWQGLPDHTSPERILPDGDGGWIVVADQMFDDQQFHTTVWALAADRRTAKRLGCSPGLNTEVRVAPAVAPDAVYLASTSDSWQLVRVAR